MYRFFTARSTLTTRFENLLGPVNHPLMEESTYIRVAILNRILLPILASAFGREAE